MSPTPLPLQLYAHRTALTESLHSLTRPRRSIESIRLASAGRVLRTRTCSDARRQTTTHDHRLHPLHLRRLAQSFPRPLLIDTEEPRTETIAQESLCRFERGRGGRRYSIKLHCGSEGSYEPQRDTHPSDPDRGGRESESEERKRGVRSPTRGDLTSDVIGGGRGVG